MISPWIEPGNFYKFISDFPEADRMDLCLQVADGLAYLHANQVIFGDLKAQNVLIGSDGVAKLTDFGLSILKRSHILFSATSTTGGGSTRWMAPELIETSTDRSFEADVYALAMTFVEILTGEFPFPHLSDDMKVMYAVSFKNATPDRPKRLEVESFRHREWWRLLTQCWGRRPEMRPKAADWNLLDRAVTIERIQQLYKQLPHALCYGHTPSGPLKNLDTDEYLPPSDVTMIFFTFRIAVGPSSEALIRQLVKLHASAIDTRQSSLELAYANTLQDLIYKSLAHTTSYGHANNEHSCGDEHNPDVIQQARREEAEAIQHIWREEVKIIQQGCNHAPDELDRRHRGEHCQMVFHQPESLKDHLNEHFGAKPHLEPLIESDWLLGLQPLLQKEKTEVIQGERNYSPGAVTRRRCTYCQRVFRRPGALRIHLNSHLNSHYSASDHLQGRLLTGRSLT
ncbi:hypothetical protein FRC09_020842 [Ceratobasidium sp. 395]|nr:hypothetical protein FRC09_020842 [Ceratobasidium sp. 395]